MASCRLFIGYAVEKSNPDHQNAVAYLMRWMAVSPEFSFAIDEEATNISKQNSDLLGIYLAGMTKKEN